MSTNITAAASTTVAPMSGVRGVDIIAEILRDSHGSVQIRGFGDTSGTFAAQAGRGYMVMNGDFSQLQFFSTAEDALTELRRRGVTNLYPATPASTSASSSAGPSTTGTAGTTGSTHLPVPVPAMPSRPAGSVDAASAAQMLSSSRNGLVMQSQGTDGRSHYIGSIPIYGTTTRIVRTPNHTLPDSTGVIVYGDRDSAVVVRERTRIGTSWYLADKQTRRSEGTFSSSREAVDALTTRFGGQWFEPWSND